MSSSNCLRRRVFSACLIALALLLPGRVLQAQIRSHLPHAQKHESRLEIDRLEDQWRDALLKSDSKAMDLLLADDYMAITAFGTLQNREQALDVLSSGKWRVTQLDLSDRKVRFYGSTAIVTSVAEVTATTPEGGISGCYRYTRVYARDLHGDWKVVNFEASRIRSPGDRKDKDEHKEEHK